MFYATVRIYSCFFCLMSGKKTGEETFLRT